jgi:hypothetical protein
MMFGDLDDPNSEINKFIAERRVTQLRPLAGRETNVVHLNIPTVFLAGTVYLPAELEEVAPGAKVALRDEESGETWETETNYFGDWEVEWLPENRKVSGKVTLDGYKPIEFKTATDTDHFVGKVYLEKA